MKLTFLGPDSQGLEVPQACGEGRLPLHGVFTQHSRRVEVPFNHKLILYATPMARKGFGCGLRRARALFDARQKPDPPDLETQNSKEEFNGK